VAEAPDKSNGYEEHAQIFMRARDQSIGPDVVRAWCRTLKPGSSVLELACGPGVPITAVLLEEGLKVWAIDASPRLLEAFRARYAQVPTECAAVEDSQFFGRTFDAVLAWGLIFLLIESVQEVVIRKAAQALNPGGQFVFTATRQACRWKDALTGRDSVSLEPQRYADLLECEGLTVEHGTMDRGENYYFFATRPHR
jgi:2-polyprenyl-3-methyl-5-hydroxy-6-metoxy-1,4-benzoquinol methylase